MAGLAAGLLISASVWVLSCASSTEPDGEDDATASAPIVDLRIAAFTATTVTLAWTATGDDGDQGRAAHYEVRRHDAFIHPGTWDDATPVADAPAPQSAGATETMIVAGLTVEATYFFALTAFDETDNSFGVSNCVSATCFDNIQATFTDAALEAAVRDALGIPSGPLHRLDLRGLTYLDAEDRGITDLVGLEEGINLSALHLSRNAITDLTPLTGLTTMRMVSLANNSIADITPLARLPAVELLVLNGNSVTDVGAVASMPGLTHLYIGANAIDDLTPLSELAELAYIMASYNQIADLAPLAANAGLGVGDTMEVEHNPLSGDAIDVQILALQARGVTVIF
jgi:hypothetical protein